MADNKLTYQDIAAYFIALANETGSLLTNLKLQKLVYYAQAWHLAVYGKPIFEEDFEAWVHGPVLPAMFQDFTKFGYRPVHFDDLNEQVLISLKQKFGPELSELLEEVVEEYFGYDAYLLAQQVHAEAPWLDARKGLPRDMPSNNIITKDAMTTYYKQFTNQDGESH